MNFCVYLIHNIKNNKVYVGKTKDPQRRWRKHLEVAFSNRKDAQYYVHRAIKKYGKDIFIFSIIQHYNNEQDMVRSEKYWIKFFNSKDHKFGYNLTDGGEGCSGRTLSNETKNKISKSLEGHKVSQDTKNKISDKLINIIRSENFKNKISKARTGYKHKNSTLDKLSESKLGIKNPQAKLNELQVLEIREKYNTGDLSCKEIACEYVISERNVNRIVKRESWRHI